ncbi:transcriptional regulator [Streptomyces sp. NPDC049879]|uniref:transcriptional regulator n=1 Tax=Streptomyces sp. NPDC049879 TaxID=3365598 RepID=UPI0037904126
MEPNILLDALLEEAGMSHMGLAVRINEEGRKQGLNLRYDNTAVIRWLRGQRPRGRVPGLICAVLSAKLGRPVTLDDAGMGLVGARMPAGSLNGFLDRATAMWRSDEQRRVRSIRVMDGMEAVAPVWEWENPPEDIDVSRRGSLSVSLDDVAVVRTVRSHYEQMYRRVGGVATRGRIVSFLNTEATPLVRGSYSDATGRELHRAIGGLVAVAGICSYDADQQGLAQRYFYQALRLAKASGDRRFGGYVMVLLVNQAVYMRDYRQAVAFAEAALRTAGTHISPALAADLHAMQAKAFARIGDRNSAHRGMRDAEKALWRIRRDEEPAETGYVQAGLVEAHFAEAFLSMGDTKSAQTYAQEAVDTQAHARGRVHRLATLARAEAVGGDTERAAATAMEMVQMAKGMESHRLRDRLVSVRTVLAQHRAKASADAVALIDDTLRVPID